MKRKLVTIGIFALALMLLICGCGGVQDNGTEWRDSGEIIWEGANDPFDPMGYVARGYFEKTKEEVLEENPGMLVSASGDWDPEGTKTFTNIERRWMGGKLGIEYVEYLEFLGDKGQEEQLYIITYYYYFDEKEDAKEYYLKLCERMREITDKPAWRGMWEQKTWDKDFDASNYREIPIEEVGEYLRNEELEIYEYVYEVDLENDFYYFREEWCQTRGYEPFDVDSIKEDARWIEGNKDFRIVISCCDQSDRAAEGDERAEACIYIMIER